MTGSLDALLLVIAGIGVMVLLILATAPDRPLRQAFLTCRRRAGRIVRVESHSRRREAQEVER